MLYQLSYTPRGRHARTGDTPAAAALQEGRAPQRRSQRFRQLPIPDPCGSGLSRRSGASSATSAPSSTRQESTFVRTAPVSIGDPVRMMLDRRHDGVAVHDLEAEVGGRGQERLADPDQVVARTAPRAARPAGSRHGRRGSRRPGDRGRRRRGTPCARRERPRQRRRGLPPRSPSRRRARRTRRASRCRPCCRAASDRCGRTSPGRAGTPRRSCRGCRAGSVVGSSPALSAISASSTPRLSGPRSM